ncbi:ABC transporter permease [Bacteroidota bacterium]
MRDVVSFGFYNKVVGPNRDGVPFDKAEVKTFENLKSMLESNDLVESVSYAGRASPFYRFPEGCVHNFGDEDVHIPRMNVDIDYADVMKIKPLKGRWFNESDRAKTVKAGLITKSLENKYFNGDAVGKILEGREFCRLEIIGVVEEFKRTDFEEPRPIAFVYNEDLSYPRFLEILARVKPGEANNFLKIAEREIMSVLDPNTWVINEVNSFDTMRKSANLQRLQRKYLGVLLAVFVMINMLLGVIGILWYNTNLRVHEIGVKRAMGATGNSVKRHLILENLIMGVLGFIVVALVYIQVPSIRFTKVEPQVMHISIIISIILMVIMILLSTWIPASLASKIRPAEALKTE